MDTLRWWGGGGGGGGQHTDKPVMGNEWRAREEGREGGDAPHPCCATKGGALRNSLSLFPSPACLLLEYTGSVCTQFWLTSCALKELCKYGKTKKSSQTSCRADQLACSSAQRRILIYPRAHPRHSFENCIIVKSPTRSGKRPLGWNRTTGRAPHQRNSSENASDITPQHALSCGL